MEHNRKTYRLTLATADVPAFLHDCATTTWRAIDTGERVLTDEGPDAEAVLLVETTPRQDARRATPLLH